MRCVNNWNQRGPGASVLQPSSGLQPFDNVFGNRNKTPGICRFLTTRRRTGLLVRRSSRRGGDLRQWGGLLVTIESISSVPELSLCATQKHGTSFRIMGCESLPVGGHRGARIGQRQFDFAVARSSQARRTADMRVDVVKLQRRLDHARRGIPGDSGRAGTTVAN